MVPMASARLLRALMLGLGPALGGCASPGSEVHLAPFYSRHGTALGTVDTELAGGMVHHVAAPDGTTQTKALRPIFSWHAEEHGHWRSYLLPPLGYSYGRWGEVLSLLVPVYIYRDKDRADGSREQRLISLPGLMLRRNSERGLSLGWFPFVGKLDQFLTYEDVFFFLWPLYVSARAGERRSHNLLWPLIGWTRGGGEDSLRVLPFFARARLEGRYDRLSVLWPFFQYHRNHLGGGGEEPQTTLWFFPFYGKVTRGTYRADSVLWPFFAWARDPRGDFRAFDGPWPLVRFQSGGVNTDVVRRRIWPFFGYFESDGLESTSYLWPFIHVRRERYRASERDSLYVLPFWQSWDRTDLSDGRTSAWRKLWPLYVYERDGAASWGAFPELDPLWRNMRMTYHYAWMWRLWTWERDPERGLARDRSWLNLVRREDSPGESRRSLSFLWAGRSYRDGAGARVRETSLLMGLLRWRRTEGSGLDILLPAFPGPGWPVERAPAAPPEVREP